MSEQEPTTVLPMPRLLAGEELRLVREFGERAPERFPSSLQELWRLAGAQDAQGVGDFGPVLASLSMETHQDDPSLHRYEAIFGRDSLRAAIDLVEYYPKLAYTTLVTLAELQGVETNNQREEEPGRIPHEVRDPTIDPVAQELTKEYGWDWPYYGSVDATPEFIRTLAAYCRSAPHGQAILQQAYVGRDEKSHTMADALQAALGWIKGRLEANPEGLLEFKRVNPGGIENQVWKDSPDAYFHADGSFASHEHGIASIEVQRATYDALLDAAAMSETYLHDPHQAQELRARAAKLRTVLMDLFWTNERGGYFVLGTDRDDVGRPRQLSIRTSNMGHLLHSRLLAADDPEIVQKREAVILQLFSPEMLGLNGIRTLASDEIRYRPGAYHNGSVWIWDNYLIAQGLSDLGYHTLAHHINDRLLDDINSTRRFPEYLRGDNDPAHRLNERIVDVYDSKNDFLNHLEQPPQDIQAWSVAAILAIKIRRGRGQHETIDPAKLALEQKILTQVPPARAKFS